MIGTSIQSVLVAVDGSDRSIETVRYLAQMAKMPDLKINLFHVRNETHESYYELARQSLGNKGVDTLKVWEKQQWAKIQSYLKKCSDVLLEAGVAPEKIKTTVQRCRQGIARDIVAEADRGYDALFLRRRGMSSLPALVMGSVALKLFNSAAEVPLVLAGRQPANHRILIAVNQLDEALRAADFVGRMAAFGEKIEVGLISVLRRDVWPTEEGESGDGAVPGEANIDLEALFDTVNTRLTEWGIKRDSIHNLVVKDAFSRAGAIVEAAEKGNFSTIVVGRNRVSRVNTFFIGRVSNKIIQIGPKQHFWIVN